MKTNKVLKRIILFVWVTFLLSCSTASMYDDTKLKDSISDLEDRVTKLETLCDQMNSNISALQAVVVALQNKEYIESIKPLPDNQGYSFSFSSGRFVTVYNGKNGKDGTDGKDGEDGRDGVDGKDGVTPVIGVRQDTDGVWYWTHNGDWLYVDGKKVKAVGVDGQDGTDGKDGVVPKLKIEEGMWYMSCDDGASWEQLGKATGDDGADAGIISVTEDGGYVHFGMSDGTVITIAKRMPLTISFDSEDVAITTGGASRTIGYTLTGASEKVVVKALTQDGWKAKVNQKSSASGTIEITAPNPLVESEILVFVSDGGQTALAAINCVKATIVISQEKYEVDAAGGNIDVTAQTNTEFQVSIPDDAKSWLSYVPTKSMATKTFNLSAAANDNAFRRNAVVSLTDDSGNVIRSFVVSQAGDMSGLISIQCDVKGDLHSILESYDKENIVKMKISGVLNDVDFLDICEMRALRYLDISDVLVDTLPDGCFYSSVLGSIILPKTLKVIPQRCFYSSHIYGDLVIPASCEIIETLAFGHCNLNRIRFEPNSHLKTIRGGYDSYTTDGYGAFINSSIDSIMIPASCETIEATAFKGCVNLENVSFESGSMLQTIAGGFNAMYDYGAFGDCKSLKSITIPAQCTTIGVAAFKNCKSLESVLFESGSRLATIDGAYSDDHYYGAFSDCVSLKSIAIPATCLRIGIAAFKNCKSLENVSFASGSQLSKISGAYSCVSYSYVSWYHGAFSDCESLKSIVIPPKCRSIGATAFKNCKVLETVVFEPSSQLQIIEGGYTPKGKEYAYFGAFSDCVSLRSITIPETCQTIEATAFKNCTALRDLVFLPGCCLTVLGGGYSSASDTTSDYYDSNSSSYRYSNGVFANCSSLLSITIPAAVETIEESCFANCTSLSKISFETNSHLATVKSSSFKNCVLLQRVDMQNCCNVMSIEREAFYSRPIKLFQIGTRIPPKLGWRALETASFSVLKVPAGSESDYRAALKWGDFSSITAID